MGTHISSNNNETTEVLSTTCSDSDTSPTDETNIEADSSLENLDFNNCLNTSTTNSSDKCDDSIKRNHWNFSKLFIHQLQFEFYHFFPSIMGVVFYCIAHISIYELITNVMLHALKYKEGSSDHRFEYMRLIMLGLALP